MVLHTNLFGYEEIVPGSTRFDDLDTLYSIVYMVLLLLNIILLLSIYGLGHLIYFTICVSFICSKHLFFDGESSTDNS